MDHDTDHDTVTIHGTDSHGFQLPGPRALRTHPRARCRGRHCVIHNPSGHHMRDWPLNWRSDTGVMERICPCGTGHPDPDHMTHVRSLTPPHDCAAGHQDCPWPHLEWQGVHGCCGCCAPPAGPNPARARETVDTTPAE
jgi:hypothetical protein